MFVWNKSHFGIAMCLLALLSAIACAPSYAPRPGARPPSPQSPQVSSAPKNLPSPESRPAPEAGTFDKETRSPARPNVITEGTARPAPRLPTAPLPDDSSLIAKISPQTPPRRAASLRLTEEGKKMLATEDYTRALGSLERSVGIDSTNPYNYYYLAKTHHQLARYQESLNFLDVAESHFTRDPYWLAETLALRGENFRALGFFQRAEASYAQALKLNPGNKTAAQGINRLRAPAPNVPR